MVNKVLFVCETPNVQSIVGYTLENIIGIQLLAHAPCPCSFAVKQSAVFL